MTPLKRNIISNLVGQGLATLTSFGAAHFLFVRLGDDAPGMIYFSMSLGAGLGAVLDLGLPTTIVREVAMHHAGERGRVVGLLRLASFLAWGSYAVAVLAVSASAPWLTSHWLRLDALPTSTGIDVLRVLAVGVLTAIPRALFASLLRGVERMELNNAIDVLGMVVQQAGVLILADRGVALQTVAEWMTLTWLLMLVAYGVAAAQFVPLAAFIPHFDVRVAREHVGFSGRMAVVSVLGAVFTQFDRGVTSHYLSVRDFGWYAFAAGAVSRVSTFVWTVAQAAYPRLVSLVAAQNPTGLVERYRRLQNLVCVTSVPVYGGLALLMPPLVSSVFGSEAGRFVQVPSVVLAVATYLHNASSIPHVLTLAANRADISLTCNLILLAPTIALGVILCAHFGAVGAALAWLFYQVGAAAYAIPITYRDCLRRPPSEWFRQLGSLVTVGGAVYGGSWAAVRSIGFEHPIPWTTAWALGTAVVLAKPLWSGTLRESLT